MPKKGLREILNIVDEFDYVRRMAIVFHAVPVDGEGLIFDLPDEKMRLFLAVIGEMNEAREDHRFLVARKMDRNGNPVEGILRVMFFGINKEKK